MQLIPNQTLELRTDWPIDRLRQNGALPMQRIAMLSVHTCPLATLGGKKTGGMNVYVRDFSRMLAQLGLQVDVFTRSQDECQPRITHELGADGRVIHIPAGPEKPIPLNDVEQTLDEFTQGVLAFAQAEGLHYDLIHSHYWLSGLVAEQLRSAWNDEHGYTPIVHMFHTLGHMKNRIARSADELALPSRLAGEAHVVQIADRLVAATPTEQAQLTSLYAAAPDKIAVIPPGVDLNRFRPIAVAEAKTLLGIPLQRKNLLFAGRIEPLKGIDTLLQAMALLKAHRSEFLSNVCVTIIGGNPWADTLEPEMARLQEMCQALDLGDLVTFAGARDQDLLPYYYAAAEIVVMPSHYESFGMVALEAMAMGTPVIASEVGGLAHLVRDGQNGYLIPVGDASALAARILRLLLTLHARQRLSDQARSDAQSYGWESIAHKMMHLYSEVIGQTVGTK